MAAPQFNKTPTSPGDLPAQWRDRAQFLSNFGDPHSARLWQTAAVELERALQELGEETLTLVEAARISGYSADHLGSLIRKGKLPNYGRTNAPRVRRVDLPIESLTSPGRPPRPKTGTDEDRSSITHIAAKLRG